MKTDEPKIGDWVLYRSYYTDAFPIEKVTPKLLRLGRGTSWARSQLRRGDPGLLGFAPDKKTALQLKQSIDGIDGEFRDRKAKAKATYDDAVQAALIARDKQVARLLASVSEGAK